MKPISFLTCLAFVALFSACAQTPQHTSRQLETPTVQYVAPQPAPTADETNGLGLTAWEKQQIAEIPYRFPNGIPFIPSPCRPCQWPPSPALAPDRPPGGGRPLECLVGL